MGMVTLELAGLEELRASLRALPRHLTQQASGIVQGRARGAADKVRAAYEAKIRGDKSTGNLVRGVTLEVNTDDQLATGATVKSRAKHAWMFENGTQVRHTDLGASRGAMPPGRVFIPIMIRERRAMTQDLIGLVQSEGFDVSGAV